MNLSDFSNKGSTASCEWPTAWLMPKDEVQPKDLLLPNKMVPNVPVSADDLRDLGISCRKVGFDAFASPVIDVDWDSSDDEAGMRTIKSQSAQHKFSYANIITLNPDHFPKYPFNEVKTVFEESSLRRKEEMCYVLVGSGFLDVCCNAGRWIRLCVRKGDLITIPEDLYHRFTADEKEKDSDVKYFAGQPFWTPLVRIMLDARIASN